MKDSDASVKLDHLDLKILAKLQTDARITNQELADAVGLSPSPCLQRVKRLERAGIIAMYQTQIDLNKVCRHVDVIAAVTLNSHGLDDFNDFEKMVAGMRHVVECTKLSGTIADRDARHAYAVMRGLTSSDGGMAAAATMSLPERARQGQRKRQP